MKGFCAFICFLGIPGSLLCLAASLYNNPNASMQQTNQTITIVVCGITFLAILGYLASPQKPEQPSKHFDQNGNYIGPDYDLRKQEPIPSYKETMKEENMTTDWQYPEKSWHGGAHDGKGNFKGGSDKGRPWWW